MPAGRPNRNNARIIVKSGRSGIPRSKCTTRRPVNNSHTPTPDTEMLAIAVPIAAPFVPNAGTGPALLINTTFRTTFSTVIALPMAQRLRGSRHQNTHSGKKGADEHDHDKEDLPAHTDGRVASKTDVMSDQRVIDNPLQAADRVLQDTGPRDLPHRRRDRSVHDRTIERVA